MGDAMSRRKRDLAVVDFAVTVAGWYSTLIVPMKIVMRYKLALLSLTSIRKKI